MTESYISDYRNELGLSRTGTGVLVSGTIQPLTSIVGGKPTDIVCELMLSTTVSPQVSQAVDSSITRLYNCGEVVICNENDYVTKGITIDYPKQHLGWYKRVNLGTSLFNRNNPLRITNKVMGDTLKNVNIVNNWSFELIGDVLTVPNFNAVFRDKSPAGNYYFSVPIPQSGGISGSTLGDVLAASWGVTYSQSDTYNIHQKDYSNLIELSPDTINSNPLLTFDASVGSDPEICTRLFTGDSAENKQWFGLPYCARIGVRAMRPGCTFTLSCNYYALTHTLPIDDGLPVA